MGCLPSWYNPELDVNDIASIPLTVRSVSNNNPPSSYDALRHIFWTLLHHLLLQSLHLHLHPHPPRNDPSSPCRGICFSHRLGSATARDIFKRLPSGRRLGYHSWQRTPGSAIARGIFGRIFARCLLRRLRVQCPQPSPGAAVAVYRLPNIHDTAPSESHKVQPNSSA